MTWNPHNYPPSTLRALKDAGRIGDDGRTPSPAPLYGEPYLTDKGRRLLVQAKRRGVTRRVLWLLGLFFIGAGVGVGVLLFGALFAASPWGHR